VIFLQHFLFLCIYIIGLGFSTRQKTGSEGSPNDRFFARLGDARSEPGMTKNKKGRALPPGLSAFICFRVEINA
jgi:hypothetical protein